MLTGISITVHRTTELSCTEKHASWKKALQEFMKALLKPRGPLTKCNEKQAASLPCIENKTRNV
jgi:hypothetical protein